MRPRDRLEGLGWLSNTAPPIHFPSFFASFPFSFALATQALWCGRQWLGTGHTLCIMAGEEVHWVCVCVCVLGWGCSNGDVILWCNSIPPELPAAAWNHPLKSPLPPGPSGLLKVCHFPIETIFTVLHCPGVKPKGPNPRVKACALGPSFPGEATSQLWELLSFS